MNAKDAIKSSAHFSSMVFKGYLADFEGRRVAEASTRRLQSPGLSVGDT